MARNDRMIEIMQKRQRQIDEQCRYTGASLDQINAHLADVKAKQESKLAGLVTDEDRTSYEDSAKASIDRELSAKKRAETSQKQIKTAKVRVKPIEIHAEDAAKKDQNDKQPEPLVIRDNN